MQIQHHVHTAAQQPERATQLREGDVYRATIKERKGNDEAVLSIRGREVVAKFEGGIPAGDRATIQVTEPQGDVIRVKTLHADGQQPRTSEQGSTGRQQELNQTLRQLGVQQPTPELRQAASILMDKGIPLTKEAVQELQRFMNEGKPKERLQTVQAIANKRLEVTANHLRAVHEALHGRPLNQVMTDLAREMDPNFKAQPVERERLERAPQSASQPIREVRQDIQRMSSVSEASEAIESRLTQTRALTSDQVREMSRALENAGIDASRGNERAGVERLAQTLERLERAPQQTVTERQAPTDRLPQSTNINESSSIRTQIDTQQVREAIQRNASVADAANRLSQLANHPQIEKEGSRVIDRAVTEARHLDKVATERVTQTLQQIERSSSPEAARQLAQEVRQTILREGLTQPVREQLDTLMRKSGALSSETVEQVEKTLRQSEQLQQVAKERLLSSLARVEQSILPAQAQQTGVQKQQVPLLEAVKQAETTLQREPSLERAIQQIQSQLSGHQALAETDINNVKRAIEAARSFQEQGRELKARQELSTMIQQIKEVATTNETQRQPVETNTYLQNEQFQTSVEMASKSIAVTTVTEKLAQMTADFKSLQRDITRNLDLVNRQIEQFRSQAQHQAKPLLETTIKKLDNAILRSEMMLLADMRTERQLMQASSQLHEAKKLLGKGQHQEANRIVREVLQLVEQLNFKPSETKIMHYTAANERALREAQLPSQSFTSQLTETAKGPVQEGSPRAMFEMVRGLGLNRDSEVAQQLASGRDQQQQDLSQRDLKTTLLQLARGEEGSRVQQLASQALNNVTGQQLLSRSDQQGNLQSMFFQLPFLLEEKVENLQVFVNSRNEGQQVDWENCSLYFLMETPKMGEIGIVVSATERQLSVTLKNDKADFQAKMEPLVEMAVEKLGEIGYSINGIKYTHLSSETEKTEQETEKSRQQPVFTEKGFDFKI